MATDHDITEVKVYDFKEGVRAMFWSGPLNILLLSAPIALMSWGLQWNDSITFIFSLAAICPLAGKYIFKIIA